MREANKLTPLVVKAANRPGLIGDGKGLYLQVSAFGTKSWLYRYMIDGQARKMGLGAVDAVPLAKAREKARQARELVADGIDPIEARNQERVARQIERAKAITFRKAAEGYIADNEGAWKNAKHRAQWASTLQTYAYPVLGSVAVADIDQALVLRVIKPIWASKTETAKRVRGRIETVLDWAKVHGYRTGENPARWSGHLALILPAPSKIAPVKNQPALPYAEIPEFMARVRAGVQVSYKALEFTILTAARTNEAIGARRSEIDLEKNVWTIPAERMKASRDHHVALSDRALEILSELPQEGEWLFPGAKAGRPLSNMAMLELVRGLRPGVTVHGFRSTFRDWAGDLTAYPRDLIEFALAHKIKDETEAAYRRSSALEKRRRLMNDWAGYCASPAMPARADNVVPMREAVQ